MISNLYGHDVATKVFASQQLSRDIESFLNSGNEIARVGPDTQVFPQPRPLFKKMQPSVITELQPQVLQFIRDKKKITAYKICSKFRRYDRTIQKVLNRLLRRKEIVAIKSGRTTHYMINLEKSEEI